jgi:hypothetical protein
MKDYVNLSDLSKLKKKKRINSRTKGNAFERKISGLLNEHYKTTEFCRTPGSGAFATTHKLPDHLKVSGDLITPLNYPYVIECKKGYKFTVSDLLNNKSDFISIIEKVDKESKSCNKEFLLIFQQDRQNIYCVLRLNNKSLIATNEYCVNINNQYLITSLEVFLTLIQPTLAS